MSESTAVFVALLRGVNVGRANRVAMADLRRLLEQLGYSDVRTLLNSGNAVFRADESAARRAAADIEAALARELGVTARVVVVGADELARAVRDNPLAPVDDPSRFLVAFLAPDADVERLGPLVVQEWAPEAFAVSDRVAYLSCVNGITGSPVAEALARALGSAVTSRNWATVVKLMEMTAA